MTSGAVVELKTGPSLIVRAIWFLLVGWWLSGLVMAIAWGLGLTVIGLPLTFYLANRIPTVLTLRPRNERYQVVMGADGVTRYERVKTQQEPILLRLVYFVLIGWWVSALWMGVAWLLCVSILGFPIGLMMVNRVPYVITLHKGYA